MEQKAQQLIETDWLRPEVVTQVYGITPTQIQRLMKEGLPHKRLGQRTILIPKGQLERWIESWDGRGED